MEWKSTYTKFVKEQLETAMAEIHNVEMKIYWLNMYINIKTSDTNTPDISLDSLMSWQRDNKSIKVLELLADVIMMTYFELNHDTMSIHSDSSVNNYIQ